MEERKKRSIWLKSRDRENENPSFSDAYANAGYHRDSIE